jgi:bis(5'-nucleosyl)-tetraphosphatase (symmetrical)
MAIWAVGDVQGCGATLEALLQELAFDPSRDRLWMAGDLVNRGPDSLGVLRRLKALGPAVTAVLGNHDLHLLAAAEGLRDASGSDTFDDVLTAPDREELLGWLRTLPLAHEEQVEGRPWLMIHAGLHPSWTVARTLDLAAEVQDALTTDGGRVALEALAVKTSGGWSDDLVDGPRLSAIVATLTRLRACATDGSPCRGFSGSPDQIPDGCVPWWAVPGRAAAGSHTVVCGHWAAQGLRHEPGMVALDTGCVWGGSLTALRLEDGRVVSVPSRDEIPPLG